MLNVSWQVVILAANINPKCWSLTTCCCLTPCICLSHFLPRAAGQWGQHGAGSPERAGKAAAGQPRRCWQTQGLAWWPLHDLHWGKPSHLQVHWKALGIGQKKGRRYHHLHQGKGSSGQGGRSARLTPAVGQPAVTGAATMSGGWPFCQAALRGQSWHLAAGVGTMGLFSLQRLEEQDLEDPSSHNKQQRSI